MFQDVFLSNSDSILMQQLIYVAGDHQSLLRSETKHLKCCEEAIHGWKLLYIFRFFTEISSTFVNTEAMRSELP